VWNPQAGIAFDVTDNLNIYASIGKKTRFPTMGELYSDLAGGNSSLEPQKTIAYEVGSNKQFNNYLNCSVALFFNDVEDRIMRNSSNEYINKGKTEIKGIEAQMGIITPWGLDFGFAYTWLSSKDQSDAGETWLDPDFHCIGIGNSVKTGKNEIRLYMDHFDNRCDPSPVYILGNFSLESARKGWNIVPVSQIKCGSWKNQGLPFYSESVSYTKELTIDKRGEYEIELPDWNGTVAEVLVNGESRGVIQSQPYTVSFDLEAGINEMSVVVYGSLKNVFGPHHLYARGFMRPPAFRAGKEIMPEGKEYDVLDYGLFEDFVIYRLNGKPLYTTLFSVF